MRPAMPHSRGPPTPTTSTAAQAPATSRSSSRSATRRFPISTQACRMTSDTCTRSAPRMRRAKDPAHRSATSSTPSRPPSPTMRPSPPRRPQAAARPSPISAPPGLAACAPTSGSQFPVGATTATCTATDQSGNAATPTTFQVIVADTTPPTVDPHQNMTAEATSAAGAVVTYQSPGTEDLVDGPSTATCAPASGSTFALGNTTVTCGAADAHGNRATSTTFTVRVVDTTPPAIDPKPNMLLEATSPQGAMANYTAPSSHDTVDGAGVASCGPATRSIFQLGTT